MLVSLTLCGLQSHGNEAVDLVSAKIVYVETDAWEQKVYPDSYLSLSAQVLLIARGRLSSKKTLVLYAVKGEQDTLRIDGAHSQYDTCSDEGFFEVITGNRVYVLQEESK